MCGAPAELPGDRAPPAPRSAWGGGEPCVGADTTRDSPETSWTAAPAGLAPRGASQLLTRIPPLAPVNRGLENQLLGKGLRWPFCPGAPEPPRIHRDAFDPGSFKEVSGRTPD